MFEADDPRLKLHCHGEECWAETEQPGEVEVCSCDCPGCQEAILVVLEHQEGSSEPSNVN